MDQRLKENLVGQASGSFLSLSQQLHAILDQIEVYLQMNPAGSKADFIRHRDLHEVIATFGSLTLQLSDVVNRYIKNEPRILSRKGVELEILNELWIAIECATIFFIRNDIRVANFDLATAHRSFITLKQVNDYL